MIVSKPEKKYTANFEPENWWNCEPANERYRMFHLLWDLGRRVDGLSSGCSTKLPSCPSQIPISQSRNGQTVEHPKPKSTQKRWSTLDFNLPCLLELLLPGLPLGLLALRVGQPRPRLGEHLQLVLIFLNLCFLYISFFLSLSLQGGPLSVRTHKSLEKVWPPAINITLTN